MPATPDIPVYPHPAPNQAWLDTLREPIIDPARPIVDPHHHLWHRDGQDYLLAELLADIGSGHNVVATVFLQCHWAYRTQGEPALRPVGETEFVRALADRADAQGSTAKVCAGIVGFADLTLGDAVENVLEAHVAAGGGASAASVTRRRWSRPSAPAPRPCRKPG